LNSSSRPPDGPVYLTAAGRRRLEEHVARYRAQVAARRSSAMDELAVGDRGDAAERLIEADDLTAVQDLLAAAQAALARAVPMPEGPDDGIVRLGSTVTVREGEGQSAFMVVDPAEFETAGRRSLRIRRSGGRCWSAAATGPRSTCRPADAS
jgi:transcription elongation GreA/GreB family factor